LKNGSTSHSPRNFCNICISEKAKYNLELLGASWGRNLKAKYRVESAGDRPGKKSEEVF
jgi:hypothetical protein